MRALFLFIFLLASCAEPNHNISIPLIKSELILDGKLDDELWKQAYRVDEFKNLLDTSASLIAKPTGLLLGYTPSALLIGAHLVNPGMSEPTMTTRDTTLYLEHCFEIFFDPLADGLNYYELEINPIGTVWDLKLKNALGQINDPENVSSWDLPSDKIKTHYDSELGYWSLEVVIPWEYIEEGRPNQNDIWSFNAMRVDYGSSNQPSYWVWQRTGKRMIHVPSTWVKLKFE